jgi:TonB-dependent receptor
MQLRPVQYRREGYVPEANMSAIRVENFDRAFVNNVRLGIINNYSFEINPNNKIYFKNVFNHIGMRETILREGNYYMEESTFKSYSFRYETRSIYSGQLQGSHDITPMTNLTWTLGSSNTLRKEPDTRRMRYIRNEANSPDFQAAIPRGATNTEASRFFSNLSESAKMASVDLEQNIRIVKGEENVKKHLKLRTGFYLENKQRDFSARWMSFAYGSKKFNNEISTQPIEEIFKAENIDSVTGLVLKEGTNPSDKYDAANKLAAGYIGVSLPLNNLNISTGVRVENNVQSINSANTSKEPINAKFPITSILPSANISYNLTDKWLIRAAYFKSVNRPEFRELAPFSYYDFNFLGGSDIIGNPNLKIATIDNADLRLEFYPSENESISIGGFYKKFKNPIERYVLVGSNPVFTFNNAISSESYGVELEMRKSLNFISQTSIIKNFSLLLNTSLINSKIKNDLSLDSSQVSQRLMQGQSPYIVNAGIYFNDSDKKVQFNLLYNVFGERLFAVGNSEIESIFELPRNILDATLTKGFGDHWEFRFGIQDILNQAVRFKQDSDQDLKLTSKDEYVNSFKRGSYFTFGVNYKL